MKKYKRNIVYSIFIVIICILVAVIYKTYITPQSSHRVFGATYMTMNNPFYAVVNNEIVKMVENHNDKLIVLDPMLDVEKQNEQIHNFIDQKVDGIFVNPIDFQKIEPALVAAHEANIPIIVVDAPVSNSELVASTIVSNNYDAGVQCALDMMSNRPQANIILLKHTTAKSAKDRIDGFKDMVKVMPAYKIINEGECEGQLEFARPMMKKMLEETPNVDVVIALNDPSALGAIAALRDKGRNDVVVYGIDGSPEIKTLMKETSMVAGTVAQSPISIGYIAVRRMYDLLEGEEIKSEYIIPVHLINKDNLYMYDEKGWQ